MTIARSSMNMILNTSTPVRKRKYYGGPPPKDLTDKPEAAKPSPGTTKRVLYRIEADENGERIGDVPATEQDATLVSSEIVDSDLHAPAIDLDIPAYLIPSSTPGHSHLYIDAEISWEKYERLLFAMADAGIIEEGYYLASVARHGSFLRRPGVLKLTPEQEEAEAIASIMKTAGDA